MISIFGCPVSWLKQFPLEIIIPFCFNIESDFLTEYRADFVGRGNLYLKILFLLIINLSIWPSVLFAWKDPRPDLKNIEYRLFNLLIRVPSSFSVEEINPFRVIFKNVPNGRTGKNVAVIEFYYFPKNLLKKSPKSNLEFVKRVWPEYLKTVSFPRNKLIAIDEKILKSVFLDSRQEIQSLMFQSSNDQKQKTRIYLFHWRDRSRIYFIQVMVLERYFERYRDTLQGILKSVKMIFEKGDDKKIKKLIHNLFKNVQTVSDVTKPKINFINKNFLKPFYFQGRIWDPLSSLKLLKGFEPISGGIILIEQDDLSFAGSKKLDHKQLLRIKDYMKEFKQVFTSGDIGALIRMESHGQNRPINRATWSYFLLRKIRTDWLIYAIGINIPPLQGGEKDSRERITW